MITSPLSGGVIAALASLAGTGKHVQISGYELWKIGNAGLIAESTGHFDAAAYERQLKHGVDAGRGD